MDHSTRSSIGPSPVSIVGWRRLLRGSMKAVLNTAYPPQCVACRAITAEPATLCARCWREMPFIARPYCERLGTPFAVDIGGALLSPAAIADPPVFNRARSVARFDGAARELVHKLKYGDRQELALAMGSMMATAAADSLAGATVIVPVPLHWTRLWRRRYNQSALIAAQLARLSPADHCPDLLVRTKATRSLGGLSARERAKMVKGAFAIRPKQQGRVQGRSVVLVDDVYTSGATADACVRALLKAGAADVTIFCWARVLPEALELDISPDPLS
jgi:ComF family protein